MPGSEPIKIVALVEDEWLVRMDVAETLAELGWQVIELNDGEEAVALLDGGRHVDLLVTDIRMPGHLTGWDVAERFRAQLPAVGVVYCSGNAVEEDRVVPGGIFLRKPCSRDDIVAMCQVAVKR